MSSFISRTLLGPLGLAPARFTNIEVVYSPSVRNGTHAETNGQQEQGQAQSSSPGFLPASALPGLVEACPSLHGPKAHFSPAPQLATGHLQTIYSAFADTTAIDDVYYHRHILLLPDGGIMSVDIAEPEGDDSEEPTDTVVISHGLTGGSQDTYVRHCVKALATSKSQGGPGLRCAVCNFRGCANTPITSPQLYSAAKTSDLRAALLFLAQLLPDSAFVGLSFSLGANIMSKYLGEEGDEAVLLAAIACAAPFDLEAGSHVLETSTTRRAVYSRAMASNLSRLVSKHSATLQLDEALREPLKRLFDGPTAQAYAQEKGARLNTLRYADEAITRHVGGYRKPYDGFPYASADDYYRNGGALNVLAGLRRPLLALNADDDPIVAKESIKEIMTTMGLLDEAKSLDSSDETKTGEHAKEAALRENKTTDYIALATTQGGGHLGWWEGARNPTRWIRTPVVEFCKAVFAEAAKHKHVNGATAATGKRNQYDQRETKEDEVIVELIPVSELPAYDGLLPTAGKGQMQTSNDRRAKREAEAAGNGRTGEGEESKSSLARLPWLRTHLLKELPLLHPSMAPKGWCGRTPASESDAKIKIDESGNIIEGQDGDWAVFSGKMIRDVKRPEVGYMRLGEWTRVGGAGKGFHANTDVPGSYDGLDKPANDGMIKGL